MLTYVLRRLIMMPLTLLGVTLLVFAMMQLLNPYQLLSAYVSSPAELKGQNIERLNYGGNRMVHMPDGSYQRLDEKQKQEQLEKNRKAVEEFCD